MEERKGKTNKKMAAGHHRGSRETTDGGQDSILAHVITYIPT